MTHLVGWGITVALASVGYTTFNFNRLADANTGIVQRVSVVETDSATYKQNISDINRKLDALLIANGVTLTKLR